MKNVFLCFLLFSAVIINAQERNAFPVPGIEFNPKHYVCYRTDKTLKIDGKLDESIWQKAEWTDFFGDIEGILKPMPRFKTRAKMLWDDKYLYIAGELEEPQLWATIKQRDAVIFYDNDFEVFIDPDGDTFKYYELEINALATAWDLLLVKPYREEGSGAYNAWDIKGLKVAVNLQGTLNNPKDVDKGWTCEIAIPWAVLRESYKNESVPKAGEQWRINFSRVEWKYKTVNNKYVKEIDPKTKKAYPEDNWVWSPQGIVNMHYPEMWGFIQFSAKTAGTGNEDFVAKPGEKAKWALRKIYYEEHTYKNRHDEYTSDIKKLGLESYKVDGYIWPPEIEATKDLFMAIIKSNDGKDTIRIKQDGEVMKP
jgi:hypothetical protein